MKCYDYECIAIVNLKGRVWADSDKSAQEAIKTNDQQVEKLSVDICNKQVFNLQLKEWYKC